MLELRAVRLVEEPDSPSAIVKRGCPHGAERVQRHRYVGVITILFSGKFVVLCDLIQKALQIVEELCTENELAVNPLLAELIAFAKEI